MQNGSWQNQRGLILSLALITFAIAAMGCDDKKNKEPDPYDNLPKVKVALPASPSFEKEHAPEQYPDQSYSVYGLRKNIDAVLNKNVTAKGFVIKIYECPCKGKRRKKKKGDECQCEQPHLYVADRAGTKEEKDWMMVVNYPEKDPETRKKIKFKEGSQYVFGGQFAKRSGTGFASSEGLIVYSSSMEVAAVH